MTLTLIPYRRRGHRTLAAQPRSYIAPSWGLAHLGFGEHIDRTFADLFSAFDGSAFADTLYPAEHYIPRVDMAQTEDAVSVRIEVPGIEEKDLNLALNDQGDVLLVSGEKNTPETSEEQTAETFYVERRFGAFSREIKLPAVVTENESTARLKDGVLEIVLKKATPTVRRIAIGDSEPHSA